MEAAQRYLEAKERYQVGSKNWAEAAARAFDRLSANVVREGSAERDECTHHVGHGAERAGW